jgi:predicted nucleotide-binding protein (sugar kinase/HSP70/actin superfamily)
MQTTATPKKSLPIVAPHTTPADLDVESASIEAMEAELRAFEEAERERIGIKAERRQWADGMLKPKVSKKEKENITLLISGLTAAQDFLTEAALRGLGYKVDYFGMSNNEGLQTGKEFGNRGQCNPTYFTVGSLVKKLIDLRDSGMTSEEVVKKYVFLTAGACGPCRFGMYVTEYRKALRDAGFDGFRVMLFQQQGGLSQATGDDVGLEFNPPFFLAVIKAIVSGDVMNALTYRIRPYEIEPGSTNRAVEECKKILYAALYEQTNVFAALLKVRKVLEAVKVDKLRPRAKTSIIGEFWAMTTEGDGNYQLQKFIESEGGENDIQLTTAWLLYNVWEVARDTRERAELRSHDGGHYGLDGMGELDVSKRLAMMRGAEAALRLGFQAFAFPAGLFDYHLPDMDLVAEVANDHYSNDLRGGEGHMEVGKLIVNVVKNKAHITVSVKPFGCMPSSSVSDGVQSLITAKFPGTIFCAVETSGDGATNFYSRVQMYMFKARIAAEKELARAYEEAGVTEAEVRAFLAKNPRYNSPLHHSPHKVAGSAANLVYEVAPFIRQSALERAANRGRAAVRGLREVAVAAPDYARKAVAFATSPETHQRLAEDASVVRELLQGKARERLIPLAQQLLGKAIFENNPEVRGMALDGEAIAAE